MSGHACTRCGHDQHAHNLTVGCPHCKCAATPNEAATGGRWVGQPKPYTGHVLTTTTYLHDWQRPDPPPPAGAARTLALADEGDLLTTIHESALRTILRIALTDLLAMTPADLEALDIAEPYRLILAGDCRRLIRATGGTS